MAKLEKTILTTDADGKASSQVAIGKHGYGVKYDNFIQAITEFTVAGTPLNIPIAIPDMIARITVKDAGGSPINGAAVTVNNVLIGTSDIQGKISYTATKALDDQGKLLNYSFQASFGGMFSPESVAQIRCPEGLDLVLNVIVTSLVSFIATTKGGAGVVGVTITID